tara:strand:+ start:119 stop:757 length:639 start_codon:yes stop_codon:yes gene_type:complete
MNKSNIEPKSNHIIDKLQMYPHVVDKKTKHDTRYDPNTYISIQTMVNNDPLFEKNYISKIVSDGWVALQKVDDILIFPKGRSFKYRLNSNSLSGAPEGTFRSGGWLIGKNYDSENSDNYILYKGYNGAIFSLQIKDLLEVYVKSPKRDIPVFKKPDLNLKSKYFVTLPNPDSNDNVIVYYAKDKYHQERFMNSTKYKKALALGKWSWSVVFN